MDLTKAYDTIDRSRTIEILKAYGVGPNIIHIITQTWEMDRMIPKQAGCYGKEFETSRGVRQGDIMSPTVFNVVVDAVVNYCEAVFKVKHQNTELPKVLFYADDGVISGRDATLVQSMLDIYSDAFLRVGLKMNVAKTESMIMRPSVATYSAHLVRPMELLNIPAKEYHIMKVCCPNCNSMVCRKGLKRHQVSKKCIRTQHEENAIIDRVLVDRPVEVPNMTIQREEEDNGTVERDEGNVTVQRVTTGQKIRVCCDRCNSMIFNLKLHQKTKKCISASNRIQAAANFVMDPDVTIVMDPDVTDTLDFVEAEGQPSQQDHEAVQQQQQQQQQQEHIAATEQDEHQEVVETIPNQDLQQENIPVDEQEMTIEELREPQRNEQRALELDTIFTVFGEPIQNVHKFKYLGRLVTDTDDDKEAVMHNLEKANNAWRHLRRIISHEKKRNLRAAVSIYRSIVESILLYGSETWILKGNLLHRLEIFHRSCARALTEDFICSDANGVWTYPHTKDVFEKAGLESIKIYIEKRKIHVANYLSLDSTAMTDIANSLNVEINMEKVRWW